MTIQLSDNFNYKDKSYKLLYGEGDKFLFNPMEYGFNPYMKTTDDIKGCLCTYKVENSNLVLSDFKVNNNQKVKLNGKEPTKLRIIRLIFKNGFKDALTEMLLDDFDYTYDNVKLKIEYTGEILLGNGYLDEYEYMMDDDCLLSAYLFKEVLKFRFKYGKLIDIEDISNEIYLKRKKLAIIRENQEKIKINGNNVNMLY